MNEIHLLHSMRRRMGAGLWLLFLLQVPALAQTSSNEREMLRVYVYTLQHQSSAEAVKWLRPMLSSRGTVEEQPGRRTLVIRDTQQVVARVAPALEAFDRPPQDLRLDIQVLRAGPKGVKKADVELPDELVDRLKTLLRYDDYRVLAEAGLTSKEGEEVTYSLGDDYDVSFRIGSVMAEQRLKLEGFRIVKKVKDRTRAKGRQLKPREMFHATLNLWMDKPFTLVLAEDESHQEALLVAISCHREPATQP